MEEKFQALVLEQFSKMFKRMDDLNSEMARIEGKIDKSHEDLSQSMVRLENKFDDQIKSLHDFRKEQEELAKGNTDDHTTFNTKIEELQFWAKMTDKDVALLKQAK